MRAMVATRIGGPEVLEVRNVPGPGPKENEVLVNVEAAGVNFADVLMVMGTYHGGPSPPFIAGREFAGTILATGERVMGYTQGSAFAERIAVRREFTWRQPEGWSSVESAAFPVNYFTAYFAYAWAGLLPKSGEDRSQSQTQRPGVLIHAVAGGVGTAAIEIGKILGVEMYGTSSSDEKLAKAKALGLDHGINYRQLDYEKAIREMTNGKGVDAVFEMLGGEHTAKSMRCLAFRGRLIAYGTATGAAHQFDTRSLYAKNTSVHGLWLGPLSTHFDIMGDAWTELSQWIEHGHLKPQVGHVLPLEKAGDAFRLMLERKNYGKIVLKV
ncbi:MAG TPA: NADPH:quinone oxidoreductase family protein [Terriglobales bacterium]|nr:NADPH:quinone oxidoreductase family protein [Terriglobales bacterium]